MRVAYDSEGYPDEIWMPKYLFKYVSNNDNSLAGIVDSYLWFSNPLVFNDPFDCRNLFDSSPDNPGWGKVIAGFLERKHYIVSRQARRAMLTRIAKSHRFRIGHVESIYNNFIENIFICCLSLVPDSTLMWAHYANSNNGMVLVFDVDKLFSGGANMFSDHGKLYNKSAINGIEVRYTNNPGDIDILGYNAKEKPSFEDNQKIHLQLLGSKTEQWAYEHEFRLISPNRGRNDIPRSALVGVVFGVRTPPDFVASVRDVVSKEKLEIDLSSAKLNNRTAQIEIPGYDNFSFRRKVGNAVVERADGRPVYTGFTFKSPDHPASQAIKI